MAEWDGDRVGYITPKEPWELEVAGGVNDALELARPCVVIVHRPHHKKFGEAYLKQTAHELGQRAATVTFKIDNLKTLGRAEPLGL